MVLLHKWSITVYICVYYVVDKILFYFQKPLSLCIAVQSGDVVQVTQLLNEQQVNMEDVINLRNDHNHAPLHLACITGSLYVLIEFIHTMISFYYRELVQLLVSHGSHVDIHGGSDAWTPLFYAAIAGIWKLMYVLLLLLVLVRPYTSCRVFVVSWC